LQTKVEDFLGGSDVESTLQKFSEMRTWVTGPPVELSARTITPRFSAPNSKYQFMEEQMLRKRRSLEEKIPELEKTLDAVTFFISKKV
jgi:hypothetical protein